MNIFKFGYYKYRSFWRSIGHNIKQFFRNIKYAYQRCIRGYADCDTWNIDAYVSTLLASMLRYLAKNGTGWPGEDKGVKDIKTWTTMLNKCADDLEFCVTDVLDDEAVNTYYKLMESYLENPVHISQGAQKWVEYINNPVYKDMNKYAEAKEKWTNAINNGYNIREEAKNNAFEFLKQYWFSLWD